MDTLLQDIKFALRTLWRTRLVTIIAIGSLTLAIAGNTTVFSLLNGLMYRPLPYKEPHRLSFIGERPRDLERGQISGVSAANFLDLQERQTSYEALAVFQGVPFAIEQEGGEPEPVIGGAVTCEFFQVLGVDPVFGRNMRAEDCVEEQNRVVIISHRIWAERFSSDPDSLASIKLSGVFYEVIGVLPEDFEFLVANLDYWVPFVIDRNEASRLQRGLLVFGRLKPNRTDESAQAEMSAIMARLVEEFPEANRGFEIDVLNVRYDIPNRTNRVLFGMMQGALLFVLLIACANLANLLLARGQVREREIAIRASFGAGRGRILRQLFTESAIMGLCAGSLGLLLSVFGIRLVNNALIAQLPGPYAPVMDTRVLIFALGVTLVGVALIGLVPLIQSNRVDLLSALKDTTSASSASGRRKRLSKLLVVGEICLSLILLGGAGVLIRSFQLMQTNDPGFDTGSFLTFGLNLPESSYTDEPELIVAADQLRERLSGLPGVSGVIVSNIRPRTPFTPQVLFEIDADPSMGEESRPRVSRVHISPGYFEIMGIPLLQGRAIADYDLEETPPVAVINQAMAQRYWENKSPIGERITLLEESHEIVGVVGTVRHGLIVNADFEPTVYLSWAQRPERGLALALKTEVMPGSLSNSVRQEVLAFDSGLAINQLMTADEFMEQFLVGQRLFTAILGGFGLLALLLAALGTYGVLAYTVAQRTHEIGIRMAIGAGRAAIMKMLTYEGLILACIGILIGIPGVFLVTRAISNQISFFVPVQPFAVLVVGLTLVIVILLASLIPAHRAATTDPLKALRPDV
ncbi:ABC transporter permease [Gemmatimonadota bacterium]